MEWNRKVMNIGKFGIWKGVGSKRWGSNEVFVKTKRVVRRLERRYDRRTKEDQRATIACRKNKCTVARKNMMPGKKVSFWLRNKKGKWMRCYKCNIHTLQLQRKWNPQQAASATWWCHWKRTWGRSQDPY